ncbi:MAG: glycosyltransferase [Leptospirillia bacterium]
MKLPSTPKIVCLYDPRFGSGYPYAFACVPDTLDRLGMKVLHVDVTSATPESFRREVEGFGPDLIFGYLQNIHDQKRGVELLKACHPVPAINWSLEDPNGIIARGQSFTMLDAAKHFDMWFCNDARMVDLWGVPAAFMPPGFDERVFFDAGAERIYDISYVGNLGPPVTARMYWPYMVEMAKYGSRALMCLDRPMGIPLLPDALERLLRSKRNRRFLQGLPLWKCPWKNPADETEKAAWINQSKIHVGMSRVRGDWEGGLLKRLPDYPVDETGMFYQLKGRLFHAVGTGTLALNEHTPELETMFDVGREIVTFAYGDVDGFADKLAWYLKHDAEREKIARAGHERGLRDHTWSARIRQIMERVEQTL